MLTRIKANFDRTKLRFSSSIDDVLCCLGGLKASANHFSLTSEERESFDRKSDSRTSLNDQITNFPGVFKSNVDAVIDAAENEFKCTVFQDVLRIRVKQEIDAANLALDRTQSEKVGILFKKRKESEKQDTIEYYKGQISHLNSMLNSLNKNGLDYNIKYSARVILSEILIGLDNATDENQRASLIRLKEALEIAFDIPMDGQNGAEVLYNDKKMEQNDRTRSEKFLARFESFTPTSICARPTTPLVSYLRKLSDDLRGIKSRSHNLNVNSFEVPQ